MQTAVLYKTRQTPRRMSLYSCSCLLLLSIAVINAAPYYGKYIGDIMPKAHQLSGKVYAANENTFQILDFFYAGDGPDVFFWVGEKNKTEENPDAQGTAIPDETGSTEPLGIYNNKTIVITLPNNLKISDLRWMSLWCKQYGVDFASVQIPIDFVAPKPQNIGEFSRLAHGLRSGDVIVEDSQTININNFHYDGAGPDAFYFAGTSDEVHLSGTYKQIPDENGNLGLVKGHTGDSFKLTFPSDVSVYDFKWLSLYCRRFTQDFGNVFFPENLNVPAKLGEVANMNAVENCIPLNSNLNFGWTIDETEITLELEGVIGTASDGYMSVGISGSADGISMIGADVVVMSYDDAEGPKANDYYLSAYAQCSNEKGACPDTKTGGSEHIRDVVGNRRNGITKIQAKRDLNTGDAKDKVYNSATMTSMVWGLGILNADGLVTKHDTRITSSWLINLGEKVGQTCPPLKAEDEEVVVPWPVNRISGKDTQNFTVVIGPTGGKRGYSALTGKQSWGIAWWVNGKLIPELELKRGVKYTFTVLGGSDPNDQGKYHPFYITDDSKGGYIQKLQDEKAKVKIFNGTNEEGEEVESQVGTFCEYVHNAIDQSDNVDTFDEFLKTINLQCPDSAKAGTFYFTPTADTPDLIYYQCYTHNWLGWKIHVVDEYSASEITVVDEYTTSQIPVVDENTTSQMDVVDGYSTSQRHMFSSVLVLLSLLISKYLW